MCALTRAFQAPTLPALVLKIMKGHYQPLPSHYSKDLKGKLDFTGLEVAKEVTRATESISTSIKKIGKNDADNKPEEMKVIVIAEEKEKINVLDVRVYRTVILVVQIVATAISVIVKSA